MFLSQANRTLAVARCHKTPLWSYVYTANNSTLVGWAVKPNSNLGALVSLNKRSLFDGKFKPNAALPSAGCENKFAPIVGMRYDPIPGNRRGAMLSSYCWDYVGRKKVRREKTIVSAYRPPWLGHGILDFASFIMALGPETEWGQLAPGGSWRLDMRGQDELRDLDTAVDDCVFLNV
ncbi:hypothetical protein Tco_1439698 [Tanacetum coccineum]